MMVMLSVRGMGGCTEEADVADDTGDCYDDDNGGDAHVGREGECGESGAAPGKVMSLMIKR